jgi:hypothetical protein
MDSTHNVVKSLDGTRLHFYTLIVKSRTTGRGVPGAFMMTDTAAQSVYAVRLYSLLTEPTITDIQ